MIGRRAAASDGALPEDDASSATGGGAGSSDLDARVVAALERAGHGARTLLWQRAYAARMSPLQAQLLLHLEGKGRPTRVRDLAAEFDVTAATVSDALAALHRKELVARGPDPDDGRSTLFTPTRAGSRQAAELSTWADPVLARLAGVDDERKAEALHLVLEVIGGLFRDGEIAVARTCLTCVHFAPDAHDDEVRPYHCRLMDTAFGDAELRVDCSEHEAGER